MGRHVMKYVIKTCSHKKMCKMIKYERFMIEVLDFFIRGSEMGNILG